MFNSVIQSRAAKWGLLASVLAVFALFSGLYLPGCSNNPTATTESDLSQDGTSIFDLPYDEAALAKPVNDDEVDIEIFYADKLFNALDGGSFVIADQTKLFEFYVAPGSLPYDAHISVEITEYKSQLSGNVDVIYDFSPDGLVFNTPAWLCINLKKVLGPHAESVKFYYLNEQTYLWEFQGEYYSDESGYACVPIEHFSKYGSSR